MNRTHISLTTCRKNVQTVPNLSARLAKTRRRRGPNQIQKRAAVLDVLEDVGQIGRPFAESSLVVILKETIQHTIRQLRQIDDRTFLQSHRADLAVLREDASTELFIQLRPPLWVDLGDRERVQCYIQSMWEVSGKSDYELLPFTIRLSNGLIESAVLSHNTGDRSFLSYLADRFNRSFRRKLGRSLDYWMAVEVVPEKRSAFGHPRAEPRAITHPGSPHLHGHFLLKRSEVKKFRQAIHTVNEPYHDPSFKNFAIRESSSDGRNPSGWGSYALKRRFDASVHLPDSQVLYATNTVKREASLFYERARQEIIAARDVVRPLILSRVEDLLEAHERILRSHEAAEETIDDGKELLIESGLLKRAS